MNKIGVFVCHCGSNIAETVDIDQVRTEISKYPGVVYAENYVYMCSDPGQKLMETTIREKGLDGIIVACCSPNLHEETFRKTCQRAGLNPFKCEIANIREQCSWVHKDDKKGATRKAIRIIRTMVEKLNLNQPLEPINVPVTKRALVIGAGIAGIQSALDIANAGYEVELVERNPSIGGHMIQLSETFPTLDCSQCILTPKMVEVSRHPRIHLHTYSEIEEISGYVGDFTVAIRQKARRVIEDKCTLCGACAEVCPIEVPSEYDARLVNRKAIYLPFPQAVPATYTIDHVNCIECSQCESGCPSEAIDLDMDDKIIQAKVGAIVVATGFDTYPVKNVPEYGGGENKDILDGLQFERLLSATGPTNGEIRRMSDGKVPKRVAFISCVGSRDTEVHLPYCSRICCMYTAKHAMLYRHKVPDGEAIIFYIDCRACGKGYEEFVTRAQQEDNVIYIRGKASKIYKDNGALIVSGADTLGGKQLEIDCDMVVLSTAMVPDNGIRDLLTKLKIPSDQYGFLSEAHPKLRPVESISAGVYVAGAAQAPKDIPDTVAQASGAASKVVDLFSSNMLYHEPTVACVDEDICAGCGICIPVCPYKAREMKEVAGRKVADVNAVLCESCGACVAACPSGATRQINYTDTQVYRMINAALSE